MQLDPLANTGWLASIVHLLGTYGYPFLMVASLAENVVILGLLIPGDAIAVLGGAACAAGVLSPVPTYAAIACGVALGAVVSYEIGVRGGLSLVRRGRAHSQVLGEKIDSAQRYFDHHGPKTVFWGCFLSGVKNLVPAVAGASGMQLGRFLAYAFSAAALRTAGLVGVGYVFGRAIDRALVFVDHVNTWMGGIIALAVVGWLGVKWLRRTTSHRDQPRQGQR